VTRRGPRDVLLFSNDVLRAELEADRPRRDALALGRARRQARASVRRGRPADRGPTSGLAITRFRTR